jgi:hypothetical protein
MEICLLFTLQIARPCKQLSRVTPSDFGELANEVLEIYKLDPVKLGLATQISSSS